MTVLVLLGGPGSGKGTQAAVLSQRLELPHVATGDLFRAAVRDGSPIGLEARRYMERGQLVPDDITIRMLGARLAQVDAARGVILDGFPRNRAQAVSLDAHLAESGGRVDRALEIDVPTEDPHHPTLGPPGLPVGGPPVQRADASASRGGTL